MKDSATFRKLKNGRVKITARGKAAGIIVKAMVEDMRLRKKLVDEEKKP